MGNTKVESMTMGRISAKAFSVAFNFALMLFFYIILLSIGTLGTAPLDGAVRSVREAGEPVVVLTAKDFYLKVQFFNIPDLEKEKAVSAATEWMEAQRIPADKIEPLKSGARYRPFLPGVLETEHDYDLSALLKLAQTADPTAEIVVLSHSTDLHLPDVEYSYGFSRVNEQRFSSLPEDQAPAKHTSTAQPFALYAQLTMLMVGALLGAFGIMRVRPHALRRDLSIQERRRLVWQRDIAAYPALMLISLAPLSSGVNVVDFPLAFIWFGNPIVMLAGSMLLSATLIYFLLRQRGATLMPVLADDEALDESGGPLAALMAKRRAGVILLIPLAVMVPFALAPMLFTQFAQGMEPSPTLLPVMVGGVGGPLLAALVLRLSGAHAELKDEIQLAQAELKSVTEEAGLPGHLSLKLQTGSPLAFQPVSRRRDVIYVIPDAVLRLPRPELHYWISRAALPSVPMRGQQLWRIYQPAILPMVVLLASLPWVSFQMFNFSRSIWVAVAPLTISIMWLLLSFAPMVRRGLQREIEIDEEAAMLFPQPDVVIDAYRRNVATTQEHPLTHGDDISQLLRLDAVRAKLLSE